MTNLQHELESLARRQSDLEDQELELMERLEVAEAALAAARSRAWRRPRPTWSGPSSCATTRWPTSPTARPGTRPRARDRRRAVPAPLLALYDRIRTQTGSTGAAMLQARQCQGCRLELYGNELSAVRNADPHEVVRCENCGRILVRTAESGL